MRQYRIMWEYVSGTVSNSDWKVFESRSKIDAWVRESNLSHLIVRTWVEYKN